MGVLFETLDLWNGMGRERGELALDTPYLVGLD